MMQFTACLLVQPSESEVRMVRSLCWVAPAEQTPRGWGSCAAAKLTWSCVLCIRCPMASSTTSCSSHPPPTPQWPLPFPSPFCSLGELFLWKGNQLSWFLIPTCHIFSLHMGNVYPWAIHPLPKLGPELKAAEEMEKTSTSDQDTLPAPPNTGEKKERARGKPPKAKWRLQTMKWDAVLSCREWRMQIHGSVIPVMRHGEWHCSNCLGHLENKMQMVSLNVEFEMQN